MVANLASARELAAALAERAGVVLGGRAAMLAREQLSGPRVAVVAGLGEAHEAGKRLAVRGEWEGEEGGTRRAEEDEGKSQEPTVKSQQAEGEGEEREGRGQKLEARVQRAEVEGRGEEAEGKRQEATVKSQEAEGEGRRAEGGVRVEIGAAIVAGLIMLGVLGVLRLGPRKAVNTGPRQLDGAQALMRLYGVVDPRGGPVRLGAPVTRPVVRVCVREGDRVYDGQELVELERSAEAGQMRAARAQLDSARQAHGRGRMAEGEESEGRGQKLEARAQSAEVEGRGQEAEGEEGGGAVDAGGFGV
jgi:hypothetical protein